MKTDKLCNPSIRAGMLQQLLPLSGVILCMCASMVQLDQLFVQFRQLNLLFHEFLNMHMQAVKQSHALCLCEELHYLKQGACNEYTLSAAFEDNKSLWIHCTLAPRCIIASSSFILCPARCSHSKLRRLVTNRKPKLAHLHDGIVLGAQGLDLARRHLGQAADLAAGGDPPPMLAVASLSSLSLL